MIKRNIKQSLTALEVFNNLENKIYNKEIKINYIIYSNHGCRIHIESCSELSQLYMGLNQDQDLYIITEILDYRQPLTDDEYTDVKKRFTKLAQLKQDEFEKWVADTTDNNEIDAE